MGAGSQKSNEQSLLCEEELRSKVNLKEEDTPCFGMCMLPMTVSDLSLGVMFESSSY